MITVRRYAAAAAACELLPVPLLDVYAQNQVRRHALRKVADARGIHLPEDRLSALADEELGGAWAIVKRVAIWPLKKLLSTVFFVIAVRNMYRVAVDVMARAEALEGPPR